MTVSEAEEKAGLGFKRYGVVGEHCVVGMTIVDASGDIVAFFAVGETESSQIPLSLSAAG